MQYIVGEHDQVCIDGEQAGPDPTSVLLRVVSHLGEGLSGSRGELSHPLLPLLHTHTHSDTYTYTYTYT